MKQSSNRPLFQAFFAGLVLLIAIAVSWHFMKTQPKAKKKHHASITPLVEVVEAKRVSEQYRFSAMGTVIADQEVDLKPRVSGQILSVNKSFTPGGFFQFDEEVLTIDPEDYVLALAQQRSEVDKAQAELNLEMGNQLVAKKEFELLGKSVSKNEKELMLRKPQLASARATLAATRAKLKIAQADLNNTKVVAPFNAVLSTKSVDLGSRVTASTTLGHFVGTDRFLIRIALPASQLRWISDEENFASPITILQGNSARSGVIANISSELEETTHMAVIYGEIKDPLCLSPGNAENPPLLLGSFVEVEITGPKLENIVAIERNVLREGGTVWILGKDGKLDIREVEIAARGVDKVFIKSGIEDGEFIITSGIDTPVSQMQLSVAGSKEEPAKKASSPALQPESSKESAK